MQIFLDSGNPDETKRALELIGSLDGQTTNPSLVAKQFDGKQTENEVWSAYKSIAEELRDLLTEEQSISLEVDASAESSAQELVEQGESINEWIPDAHIKLPITTAGLEAAEQLVRNGIQVNMTLCFTREQAYAVHLMAESAGATRGQVFVSPFMGRLDDIGEDGLQLIEDISRMLKGLESPVLNLAASVRSVEHIEGARLAGADIITIPFKMIEQNASTIISGKTQSQTLVSPATLEDVSLEPQSDWRNCNLKHPLTKKGLQQFSSDWKALIS